MIANQRQYRITKAEAARFERAVAASATQGADLHPRLHQAMKEGLESQLNELREEMAAYEALRDGQITVLELEGLRALPAALVRGRIASGLTQKELAGRLGLKEQQVQRYESTQYRGVSLERVQAVADALGVKIREEVELPTASKP